MSEQDSDPGDPFQDPDATVAIQRIQVVTSVAPDKLDDLPFGVIQLDRTGTVLSYNRTEAELAGLDPQQVLGENFFTAIAPCTNVQDFAGRFRAAFDDESPCVVFPYRFDFTAGPVHVTVSIHVEPGSDIGWILVHKADTD